MTARSDARSLSALKSAFANYKAFSVRVDADRPFIGYLDELRLSTISLLYGSEILAEMAVIIAPDNMIQSISTRFVPRATAPKPTARARQRPEPTPAKSKKSASGKKIARASKSQSAKSNRAASKRARRGRGRKGK